MVPDRDRTRNPWICSLTRICCQTRYRLRYAARLESTVADALEWYICKLSWHLSSCLWCLTVSLLLSHWYPGSGVVLDCIDSWSLPSFLLCISQSPILFDSLRWGCGYFGEKKLNFKNYHFQELCFSKVSNVRSTSASFGKPHLSLILTKQCLTIMVRNGTVSYINFWKDKIHDDSKNQPNGNKLRTYRIFKKCYEREAYLFVNELSKSEISTFAKLRISSHDLHIEKDHT